MKPPELGGRLFSRPFIGALSTIALYAIGVPGRCS